MGGPGAGLTIALEDLFPPMPSELILPLTGFAAGRGEISLFSALFWTTLGSVVGAAVLYGLGALLGRRRMHALWARLPLVKPSDLTRTEEWFGFASPSNCVAPRSPRALALPTSWAGRTIAARCRTPADRRHEPDDC